MWTTNLLSGVFLFVLGYLIRRHKLALLIAGYNTAPKREKERYDVPTLTRYVGNLIMGSAAILMSGGFAMRVFPLAETPLMVATWIMFVGTLIAGLIYINMSPHVHKVN